MARTLTEEKCSAEDNPAGMAEQQRTHVVDAVDVPMAQLEDADDIVGPGGDAANDNETDDAGDNPEGIKGNGNGEHAETDLRLHHEHGSSQPADLDAVSILILLTPSHTKCVHCDSWGPRPLLHPRRHPQ
jgi:hypothetical protein